MRKAEGWAWKKAEWNIERSSSAADQKEKLLQNNGRHGSL